MQLSIVIPALNETAGIEATLLPLQPHRVTGLLEVIVVDGGSIDSTAALATPLANAVITAPRGRASQMNAGAARAQGNLLLFLHADSVLTAEAILQMLQEYARSGRHWGRFDVAFDVAATGHSPLLRVVATLMNARSRMTGIATGDQALFVARDLFDRAGGFPPQPLMEDIAFCATLKRIGGKPLCTPARVLTSARRWQRHGIKRTVLHMWRLRWDYWRGESPIALAARYNAHR